MSSSFELTSGREHLHRMVFIHLKMNCCCILGIWRLLNALGIRLSPGIFFFRDDFVKQRQEGPWQVLLALEYADFCISLFILWSWGPEFLVSRNLALLGSWLWTNWIFCFRVLILNAEGNAEVSNWLGSFHYGWSSLTSFQMLVVSSLGLDHFLIFFKWESYFGWLVGMCGLSSCMSPNPFFATVQVFSKTTLLFPMFLAHFLQRVTLLGRKNCSQQKMSSVRDGNIIAFVLPEVGPN